MRIRAPGKAFVSGEYAVLHGTPAVVAAVRRYAWAWLEEGDPKGLSPFLFELIKRLPPPDGRIPVVDSSSLQSADGEKLGLGASAAVTVAAAGAIFVHNGMQLADPDVRAKLLSLCVEAHRAAQGGRGSGGDVAASVWGGLVRVTLEGAKVSVAPARLPDGYVLKFFKLGGGISTPEMLTSVETFAREERVRYSQLMDALSRAAASFEEDPIGSMRAQLRRLGALGMAAGIDIVPKRVWEIAAKAEAIGGAAKPSGAGGGELTVALVPKERLDSFLALVHERPLPLDLDEEGVTVERDGG